MPQSQQPIRVVLAEHAYAIREHLVGTLSAAPEVELSAICSDARELQTAIDIWSPDVVVTDIRMPRSGAEDGIRFAARLHETAPELGVIVLSQYAEPAYALALLETGSGRRGYLLKERVCKRDELIGAIANVAQGGSVIDSAIVAVLIAARSRTGHPRVSQLTVSERELLAEIAAGRSNGAIAKSLSLTKRAVENAVDSVLGKLDLPQTQDVSRRVKATLVFLEGSSDFPVATRPGIG